MTDTSPKTKSRMSRRDALAKLGLAAAAAYMVPTLLPLGEAHASGDGGGFFGLGGGGSGGGPRGFGSGRGSFNITDQTTMTECGDCHEPYDGDALPQGSWRKIMGNLENHFGEDASVDAQTRNHIEDYLMSKAPRGDGPLRITETNWFVSEHRGEVSRASVGRAKGMHNCSACHK